MLANTVEPLQMVATEIPDVKMIQPSVFEDGRGSFSEVYNRARFAASGIDADFVQDNHSLSRAKGVIRGLHFQIPPFAQAKLVRVIRGSIFDVAVDIRMGSVTYGKFVTRIVSAADWNQLFVPIGFAHGFCTLEAGTEVLYKTTNYYSREHERGVFWNDPNLGIPWPIRESDAVLSDKDRDLPSLPGQPSYFLY